MLLSRFLCPSCIALVRVTGSLRGLPGRSPKILRVQQQARVPDHTRCSARNSVDAVSSGTMAAEILQKKHRFILVSDLDWTMVR